MGRVTAEGWTRLSDSYCYPTAAKPSIIPLRACLFLRLLQVKLGADERAQEPLTPAPATSDNSGVAGDGAGLQILHI